MSRTLKEMAAELGMFVASVALLACLAVAVFEVALADYGAASESCPAAVDGGTAGTANWSALPPGITCTYGEGAAATTEYRPGTVPLALAGAAAAALVLVGLRKVSLTLQRPNYRDHDPVYAEDILDELERRRRRRSAAA